MLHEADQTPYWDLPETDISHIDDEEVLLDLPWHHCVENHVARQYVIDLKEVVFVDSSVENLAEAKHNDWSLLLVSPICVESS